MSDNKKWFKVWTTILNDEGFEVLSDELIGCWVRLGARTALIGTAGQCRFLNEASFTTFMRCKTFKEAVSLARKLPNLTVSLTPKNDNDTITVTHFTKWKKHQEDSTSYDRVKRYRERHRIDNDVREEEKRREKKRGEETPPVTAFNPRHGTPIKQEATYYCPYCSKSQNKPISHFYPKTDMTHIECYKKLMKSRDSREKEPPPENPRP